MSCLLSTLITNVLDAVKSKKQECGCQDHHLPSNQDDMCGDGTGLVRETRDAINSMKAECELVQGVKEDPGEPSDCGIGQAYLIKLQGYVNDLQCKEPEPTECQKDMYSNGDSPFDLTRSGRTSWFDGGRLFAVGTYSITHLQGAYRITNRHPATLNVFHRWTFDGMYDWPYYREYVEIRVVVKDAAGNETTQLVTDYLLTNTKEQLLGAQGGHTLNVTIDKASQIGMRIATSVTINPIQANAYSDPPRYAISVCPKRCEPEPVTNARYVPPSSPGGDGEFQWDYDGNYCHTKFQILYHKLADYDDCSYGDNWCATHNLSVGNADHIITVLDIEATSEAITALSDGQYCARIDAIFEYTETDDEGRQYIVEQRGEGMQWCFSAVCEYPLAEYANLRPADGKSLSRSATHFTISLDYRYAMRAIVWRRIGNYWYDWQIASEHVLLYDPTGAWHHFSVVVPASCCAYQYWKVVLYNPCGQWISTPARHIKWNAYSEPNDPPPNCTSGDVQTLDSWTVINGGPVHSLSAYANSGSNFNSWRIVETGSDGIFDPDDTFYDGGDVVGGVLVGLPSQFDPLDPKYYADFPYTGYMELQLVC